MSQVSPPLTLGTAGHIDHGKSRLITALTGRDTDRLPEERGRGISIELGYAPLDLPSARRLSVIDVPGHERFVRTMVAGASGIDMFLLCVAADDGVMPQTREHLAVLRALGVDRGVVAVTKADIGEPELAAEEVSELLPGTEAVAVSAPRGTGIAELRAALDRVAAGLRGRGATRSDDAPLLHIDRSFTLRGIGTVVTGTLWSGALSAGDSVRVLPRGLEVRVRSVQVHGEPVEQAHAGQRVALNLAGVRWRELERGDVLSSPGADLEPTYRLDARVELHGRAERPLERGTRVHIHHGTREAPGRLYPLERATIEPGAAALAQLRLESPLVPAAGDRVVVRQIAPPDTLGGGLVVDPRPRRHGGGERVLGRLARLERGEPPADDGDGDGEVEIATTPPEPAATALDAAALRLAAILREDGERPRADPELAEAAGLQPAAARSGLGDLVRAGEAVRVARNLHFSPEALARLESRIVALCERDGEATIAGVRDELGTSRRYAQALLEHLDATKVTRRLGDAHVLRRRR